MKVTKLPGFKLKQLQSEWGPKLSVQTPSVYHVLSHLLTRLSEIACLCVADPRVGGGVQC